MIFKTQTWWCLLKLILFTLTLCLIFAPSGFSQADSSFDLNQCIQMALEHSYLLKSDSMRVAEQTFTVDEAKSHYYPDLLGDVSHNQLYYGQYDFKQQSALMLVDWSLGDWIRHTADSPQNTLLAKKADMEDTRLRVSSQVAMLYINVLQKQTEQSRLQERLELLQEHYKVTQALWQAGIRTQLDVLQTEAEIQDTQSNQVLVQMDYDLYRRELGRLMQIPFDRIKLNSISFNTDQPPESFLVSNSLLEHNPLMQSLQFQIQAELSKLNQVSASKLPHIQMNGGYVVDHDPTADGDYWIVGAGVQFPIMQWKRSFYQKQQVLASSKALQFQQKAVERELNIRYDMLTERIHRLLDFRRLQQQRSETSKKTYDIATANYQAGLVTNLEFLDAQQKYMEARIGLEQSRLDIVLNLIDLYIITQDNTKLAQLQ